MEFTISIFFWGGHHLIYNIGQLKEKSFRKKTERDFHSLEVTVRHRTQNCPTVFKTENRQLAVGGSNS